MFDTVCLGCVVGSSNEFGIVVTSKIPVTFTEMIVNRKNMNFTVAN